MHNERIHRRALGGVCRGVVSQSRYGSASEVVREGLRLVEEREAKLAALRETLDASIARGGSHSAEDVSAAVRARLDLVSSAA
jgi:antitoxin ParD1/3/4